MTSSLKPSRTVYIVQCITCTEMMTLVIMNIICDHQLLVKKINTPYTSANSNFNLIYCSNAAKYIFNAEQKLNTFMGDFLGP